MGGCFVLSAFNSALSQSSASQVDFVQVADRASLAGQGPTRSDGRSSTLSTGSTFVLEAVSGSSIGHQLLGATLFPLRFAECASFTLLAGRGDDQFSVSLPTSTPLQRVTFDGGVGDDRLVLQTVPASVLVVALGGLGGDTFEVAPISSLQNVLASVIAIGEPPLELRSLGNGSNLFAATSSSPTARINELRASALELASGAPQQLRVIESSRVVGFGAAPGVTSAPAPLLTRVQVEPLSDALYINATRGWRLSSLRAGTTTLVETRMLPFGASAFEVRRALCAAIFDNCTAASDGDVSIVVLHVPAERSAAFLHPAATRDVYYVQLTGVFVASSTTAAAVAAAPLGVVAVNAVLNSELRLLAEPLAVLGGIEYARVDRLELTAPGDAAEALLVRGIEAARGANVALGTTRATPLAVRRTVVVASQASVADASVADGAALLRPAGSLDDVRGSLSVAFAASSTLNRVLVSHGDAERALPARRTVTLDSDALDGLVPTAGATISWPGAELGRGLALWTTTFSDRVLVRQVPAAAAGSGRRVLTTLDVSNGNDLVELRVSGASASNATTLVRRTDALIVVRGGAGDDVLDGDNDASGVASSCVPLVLVGGAGSDNVRGGSCDDVLFGDDGRLEWLDAGGVVVGALGGGASFDIVPPTLASSDASLAFSVQCDTTTAPGVSADELYGGVGRDVLIGGRGGDRLTLGTESDILDDVTSAGDVLIGDSGLVQFGASSVGAFRAVTRVVTSFVALTTSEISSRLAVQCMAGSSVAPTTSFWNSNDGDDEVSVMAVSGDQLCGIVLIRAKLCLCLARHS